MQHLTALPAGLPVPIDDGACTHLTALALPAIQLMSSDHRWIDLSELNDLTVIYIYPMMGDPKKPLPDQWDSIAGVRGCTPQACNFRDHFNALSDLNASVYGLSMQSTADRQAAVQRLHLPYPLLSDPDLRFAAALQLPTFTLAEVTRYQRVSLICQQNVIRRVFYPVFPPDKNAQDVLLALQALR